MTTKVAITESQLKGRNSKMKSLISHRRRLWRWVGIACALVTTIAAAGDTSRGQFAVWAIGLPDGYVTMKHQAPVIQITPDDVARGVVQVRDGSRLVVTTDSPAGYAVDFYTRGNLFQAVQIDGIGSAVELGPKGGTVVQRAAAANQDRVDANANLLLAIVLGLLALLYIALLLVVRHGQRIIDKQDFARKRAELALLRQKDLYNVLSQSNKAIVRLVARDELFAAVCRIAVEHGRFRFAWIGLIHNDDQRLKPVARYGEDAGYIDQLDVSGDGASALSSEGSLQNCQVFLTDNLFPDV